tara:strand:+ start:737 stop:1177 length:441 start_codon:yes stop_codon:yes gene_type:complete
MWMEVSTSDTCDLKKSIISQLQIDQHDRNVHYQLAKKQGNIMDFLSDIIQLEDQFTANMLSFLQTGTCEDSISTILKNLQSIYTEELNHYMFENIGEILCEVSETPNSSALVKKYKNECAIIALSEVSMYNLKHMNMLYDCAMYFT